jgi:hypothetical protein
MLVLSSGRTRETVGQLDMAPKLMRRHDKVLETAIVAICDGKRKAGTAS